ncbi:hypothetical protein HUB94_20630 (plasmid) [Paenibacillus cellulosilyticus]|nr:hypothetical protein HUB94_20630 [Paenibacillus cellulosilyticus]
MEGSIREATKVFSASAQRSGGNHDGEASAFAFVSGLLPFLILYNQNNLDTTAIGIMLPSRSDQCFHALCFPLLSLLSLLSLLMLLML